MGKEKGKTVEAIKVLAGNRSSKKNGSKRARLQSFSCLFTQSFSWESLGLCIWRKLFKTVLKYCLFRNKI